MATLPSAASKLTTSHLHNNFEIFNSFPFGLKERAASAHNADDRATINSERVSG
jgi:hypothetical protein